MSSEFTILALYGLLIIVLILVDVLFSIKQFGIPYMSSARDEGRVKESIAGRADRATTNAAIGMALFAPAVLALSITDQFTATALFAAQIYLIARVIWAVVYLIGTPLIRTLSFVVALLANAYLYLLAL